MYGDRARVAKREWAAIAGRTYGVRVAADWRPEGWLADYDHMTPQIAEERVTNARDALNALHRVQAISESGAGIGGTGGGGLAGVGSAPWRNSLPHGIRRTELNAMPSRLCHCC